MDGELMEELNIKTIVEKVMEKMKLIPIEVSARHVHLCKEDVEKLFGKDHKLTPLRDLSQPGQFLCKERVSIIGPKGIFKNVAILGPERKDSQAEISMTDAIALGVDAPIRESGEIEKSAPLFISVKDVMIRIEQGAIVAKRHIHMTPENADAYGLRDKQIVSVKVLSDRPVIFQDVTVRVNKNFSLNMHLDFDEANACNFKNGMKGQILTEEVGII